MFKDPKLLFAIITVALVWGTTFLTIRIAVESIPPWFVAGLRQVIAGFLLLVFLLSRGQLKWIGWKNLRIQLLLSTCMLIIANGMTTVAEEHISSSLASLVSAASPLLIFIGSVLFGLQKFSYRALIGVILGFAGIFLIFKDSLQELMNPDYRMGVIFMFVAITGWALGTIFSKKMNVQAQNISLNLFYQFSFAGIIQVGFGFLFSDQIAVENWTFKSILAVIYLAIFGSVIAFFAFHYALKKITPTQISLLSYINTIIAIFLGWLILGEEISAIFIAATALIICGVFITNYRRGMFNKT